MAFDADAVLDRRRLKRRLNFWRGVGLFAVVAAVVFALGEFGVYPERAHVARLTVEGIIVDDQDRLKAIERAAEDRAVKAILVRVNSPGGTTTGGETLFIALRRAAEAKPVVAVMGGLAASAGYIVALAGDRVFARETTVTGSIGVLFQSVEVTRLLDNLGIQPLTIKSAPLKAVPSPLEPLDAAGRAMTQVVVDDTFAWFVELVAARRGFSLDRARQLADGRIFTGRQALGEKLIDELGGESEARAWLKGRDVPEALPIRDLRVRDPRVDLLDDLLGRAAKAVGLERLALDGLVSLWNPAR